MPIDIKNITTQDFLEGAGSKPDAKPVSQPVTLPPASADYASPALDEIMAGLDKIEERYSLKYKEPVVNLPESLNLERLTYQMPDDDELMKTARQSVAATFSNRYISAYNDAAKSEMTAQERITNENLAAALKEYELEKSAESARKKAQQTSVKQGVARSSIQEGRENAVNTATEEARGQLEYERATKVGLQNAKLGQIAAQLQFTISMLDKDSGEAARAKAATMLADAAKQLDAVTKYNNTAEEKESNYLLSVEKAQKAAQETEIARLTQLFTMVQNGGMSAVQKQKDTEKLDYLKEYLGSMNKAQAMELYNAMGGFAAQLGGAAYELGQFLQGK